MTIYRVIIDGVVKKRFINDYPAARDFIKEFGVEGKIVTKRVKRMGRRENKIQVELRKAVEAIGGEARKWVSPGRAGVPDQIVFYNSLVILVETKTLNGSLSPQQIREQKRLRKTGAVVFNIFSEKYIDWVIGYLRAKSNVETK